MAAAKLTINGEQGDEGTLLQIEFPHGPKRSFLVEKGTVLYDQFAAYGAMKKIRDQITGKVGTDEAVAEVDELIEGFNNGLWNPHRDNEAGPTIGLLAHALMRLYGSTREQAEAFVKKLSRAQQVALREKSEVAKEILLIKEEEVAKAALRAPAGKAGKEQDVLLADFARGLGLEPAEPEQEQEPSPLEE